jgi:hypothetical protein
LHSGLISLIAVHVNLMPRPKPEKWAPYFDPAGPLWYK